MRSSGYSRSGGRWRTLKRRILQRDGGRCYACGGDAITADHVTPVGEGGDLWDENNLAAICKTCHDAKTAAETARGAQRAATARRDRHANLSTWHEPHPNAPHRDRG
ncbi:HNH endonuclease [Microbacterium xylanilyticum]